MHYLIFVRHGSYDKESGNLDRIGINQALKVVNTFREFDPMETIIFSSPILRAKQTADEIARKLGGPGQKILTSLASDSSHSPDIPKATTQIEKDSEDFENIFIIGHAPSINQVINFFFRKFISEDGIDIDLSKGEAFLIDLKTKKGQKL